MVASFVAVLLGAASAAPEDVLDRCDAIGESVFGAARRGMAGDPLRSGDSRRWVLPRAARVALGAGEAAWFLELNRGLSLRVGAWPDQPPHALQQAEELMRHMRIEPRGAGSYWAMRTDFRGLVRRDAAWKHWDVGADRWVIRFERERDLPGEGPPPWNGKWKGAYSVRRAPGPGGAGSSTGGPFSALILQDGERASIHLAAAEWRFTATGVIIGDRLSAETKPGSSGRRRSVTAVLQADHQSLRGSWRGLPDGNEAAEGVFFLQRVTGGS